MQICTLDCASDFGLYLKKERKKKEEEKNAMSTLKLV